MVNEFGHAEKSEDCKDCPYVKDDFCKAWDDKLENIFVEEGDSCTELARPRPKPKEEQSKSKIEIRKCIIRDCEDTFKSKDKDRKVCRKHHRMIRKDLMGECMNKGIETEGICNHELLQKLIDEEKENQKPAEIETSQP